MPFNGYIRKEDYIEVGEGDLKEAFRVTGYDIHSTPGVEYVTLNPMYVKDQTPAPEQKPEDNSEDYVNYYSNMFLNDYRMAFDDLNVRFYEFGKVEWT